MKTFNTLLISIIIFATASCSSDINVSYTIYKCDTIQNIDLNPCLSSANFYMEDILDSVKIICLETNNQSLLSSVTNVILSNDRIFIKDLYQMSGVSIFDSNGKFIKRMPSGNGPGELHYITDYAYDKYNDELLLIDSPFIKRFDKDGNFKGEIELKYPCCKILSCNKDSYIISNVWGCSCDIPTFENYSTIVVDREFNINQLLLPFNNSNKIVPSFLQSMEYNDNVLISVPYCDTIYRFRNDSLWPYKTIDFSSEKRDVSQYSSLQDYTEKVVMAGDISKASFTGNYYENSTHQIIGIDYGTVRYSIFINKKSNSVKSGAHCCYNPEESVDMSYPAGVFNDWYYQVKDARDFPHNTITSNRYISKEDLAKLEQLKEDSNPFIMFYKLKDF